MNPDNSAKLSPSPEEETESWRHLLPSALPPLVASKGLPGGE